MSHTLRQCKPNIQLHENEIRKSKKRCGTKAHGSALTTDGERWKINSCQMSRWDHVSSGYFARESQNLNGEVENCKKMFWWFLSEQIINKLFSVAVAIESILELEWNQFVEWTNWQLPTSTMPSKGEECRIHSPMNSKQLLSRTEMRESNWTASSTAQLRMLVIRFVFH